MTIHISIFKISSFTNSILDMPYSFFHCHQLLKHTSIINCCSRVPKSIPLSSPSRTWSSSILSWLLSLTIIDAYSPLLSKLDLKTLSILHLLSSISFSKPEILLLVCNYLYQLHSWLAQFAKHKDPMLRKLIISLPNEFTRIQYHKFYEGVHVCIQFDMFIQGLYDFTCQIPTLNINAIVY